MENIINFISNIDNSTYNKIRHSKSDAECRRYLKEQLTKQLTLTDVVHTLKDCLIAQKPVEYNGKKYYVSKLDIMQNGDEFCDLIDIETYDCIDDIKSTEVKIF